MLVWLKLKNNNMINKNLFIRIINKNNNKKINKIWLTQLRISFKISTIIRKLENKILKKYIKYNKMNWFVYNNKQKDWVNWIY